MICVFDKHTEQNDFNTCGLRVLNPVSAYINEELNGKYTYEVSCPMLSDDDSWRFIKPFNIIKSSTGQLFQISKTVTSTVNGVPTITAYADHIWYYLADMFVIHAEGSRDAYGTMRHIFTELKRPSETGDAFDFSDDRATLFSHGTGLTDYNFRWSVDLEGSHDYKFDCVSLAYAILGSSESVVNQYEGYLHRDNFRFSINKGAKEGSIDNAFELLYGINCTEVKCTYDFSGQITEHWGFGREFSQWYGVSVQPDAGFYPHQVITAARYVVPSDTSEIRPLVLRYYSENHPPRKTYEVNFVDPKGTGFEQSEWGVLRGLKVGDRGYVTSLDGDRDEQVIISTKYNDITERVDSLKLGKFIRSQLHESSLDGVTYDDDSASRRLDKLERRLDYFELVKGD